MLPAAVGNRPKHFIVVYEPVATLTGEKSIDTRLGFGVVGK